MELQLLSSFGKKGVDLGLFTLKPDIEDTAFLSQYFDITEFNPVFTAGKNPIAFNGSKLLAEGSEIKIQCIDSNGNTLYIEYPKSSTQYADTAKFLITIHIYNEVYNGAGNIAFVGTTSKGEIVRWKSNITIDKTLQNASKTRFQYTPSIEVRPLLYPVISNDTAASMTSVVNFMGVFYSNALIPQKDTLKSYINPKKMDTDYRISFNITEPILAGPQIQPTHSFNTQMENQYVNTLITSIQDPFSYREKQVNISSSFRIKKVINNNSLQTIDPFFVSVGKDSVVTDIKYGTFTSSYKYVAYNTASDIYSKMKNSDDSYTYQKESYAEVTYRNLTVFSGFIARHKLYRKSMLYPGDFQLVIDEPIGTRELLVDPVTANKTYNLIGSFYNQIHIEKYWFTSSKDMSLIHSVTPRINAMSVIVSGSNYDLMDGTKYIIVKTDSVDTIPNDYIYRPYDSEEFNNLQGLSYQSNFIDLKAGSLYSLSFNLAIDKSKSDTTAKIEFYFTSSVESIKKEKYWSNPFGLKLGEVAITDLTNFKFVADKKYIYFTPMNDYYGALVIVPYHCGVTLSELSLGVYSDHGFSPDSLTTKVPFPINVANETWKIKSELFDINSTLAYNNLNTLQTFDPEGESLTVFIGSSNMNPSRVEFVSGSLTVSQSLYDWNMPQIAGDKRLVGYILPTNIPRVSGDGLIGYTNIKDISLKSQESSVNTLDYIDVITTGGEGKSIVVNYDSATDKGRRIWIENDGTKHTWP